MASQDPERSESGDRIYRHDQPPKDFTPPEVSAAHCEQISDHVKRHVGDPETVLHEILSHLVHIDVLVVKPTPEAPYYTLVTSGMSDQPMHPPPEAAECQYAELAIRLPGDWPMDRILGAQEKAKRDPALEHTC